MMTDEAHNNTHQYINILSTGLYRLFFFNLVKLSLLNKYVTDEL